MAYSRLARHGCPILVVVVVATIIALAVTQGGNNKTSSKTNTQSASRGVCGVYQDVKDETTKITPEEVLANPEGYFPDDFVWGTATSSYQIEGK